jgi:hypothetical protein
MASSERQGGLLGWQWRGYSRNHCDRVNLLVHMIAVPFFIAGMLAFVVLSLHAQWLGALVAILVAVAAFVLQGVGHKREREAPQPFAGPSDFVARVFAEQFITFPRFVLTGQWARNLAGAGNRG